MFPQSGIPVDDVHRRRCRERVVDQQLGDHRGGRVRLDRIDRIRPGEDGPALTTRVGAGDRAGQARDRDVLAARLAGVEEQDRVERSLVAVLVAEVVGCEGHRPLVEDPTDGGADGQALELGELEGDVGVVVLRGLREDRATEHRSTHVTRSRIAATAGSERRTVGLDDDDVMAAEAGEGLDRVVARHREVFALAKDLGRPVDTFEECVPIGFGPAVDQSLRLHDAVQRLEVERLPRPDQQGRPGTDVRGASGPVRRRDDRLGGAETRFRGRWASSLRQATVTGERLKGVVEG